jgi:hypothetical protein
VFAGPFHLAPRNSSGNFATLAAIRVPALASKADRSRRESLRAAWSVGKRLGAIMPPIGEWAISFTGIIQRRFQTIGDTTEHDGFGYHGVSQPSWRFDVPQTIATSEVRDNSSVLITMSTTRLDSNYTFG